MAKHNSIPIWSIDGKSAISFIDPDVAAEKRHEKHWDGTLKYRYQSTWIHGKGKRESLQLTPTPRQFKSSQDHSPCSITSSESARNAFLRAVPRYCPAHGPQCEHPIWRGSKENEGCSDAVPYMEAVEKVQYYDPTAMRRELYA